MQKKSFDSTHGRAAQYRATHTVRARLTTHIFQFSRFTISRVKFKPLIRFRFHFRLRVPYT